MSAHLLPEIKRRYFEAFGDLEEEISHLRRVTLLLAGLLLAAIFLLFLAANKPPVVIRVAEVGRAQVIEDLKANNQVSEYEILGFAKRFTLKYTGYNSYTVSRDFTDALNQMTRSLQKEAQKRIVDSGLLSKIAEAKIDTAIEFKEIRLERETEDYAVVSLIGLRRITQYDTHATNQKTLFRADLVLKKVARSRSVPEGLLVAQYQEIILNDVTERK